MIAQCVHYCENPIDDDRKKIEKFQIPILIIKKRRQNKLEKI